MPRCRHVPHAESVVRSLTFSCSSLLMLCSVPACTVDLPFPDEAIIACASDNDCPTGRTCASDSRCYAPVELVAPTSDPALLPPAGQIAVKNGDKLTVAGTIEAGARVARVSLVLSMTGAMVAEVSGANLQVDAQGVLSGAVTASGLSDGDTVAIEVISIRRGVESIAADSRSAGVTVDLAPPAPPQAKLLTLRQQGRSHFLSGVALASGEALHVVVLDAEGQFLATAEAESDGSFAEMELPPTQGGGYVVRGIDGAGNESASGTPIALPTISLLSAYPQVGRRLTDSDRPFIVSFQVDGPLATPPQVRVAGIPATFASGDATSSSGDAFVYEYRGSGAEPEGIGAVTVEVVAEASHGILAPGSTTSAQIQWSFDFTAPTITPSLLILVQAPPGMTDSIAGKPEAIIDRAALRDVNLNALPAQIYAYVGTTFVGTTRVAGDGSFSALALGDNAGDTVTLQVADAAGNLSSVTLSNDTSGPTISKLATSKPSIGIDQQLTISFVVQDGSDLNAAPSVMVGERAATKLSGLQSTSQGTQAWTFSFTALENTDTTGKADIIVTATDAAANVSQASTSVYLDVQRPTCTITVPSAGSWGARSAVTGKARDHEWKVNSVQVSFEDTATGEYWNGSSFYSSPTWIPAFGEESTDGSTDESIYYLWSGFAPDPALMNEGHSYLIEARTTDFEGNSSPPCSVAVTFLNQGPTPPTQVMAETYGEAAIRVTWANPGANGSRIYYRDEHTSKIATDSIPVGAGTTEKVLTNLREGAHTIWVVSLDGSNRESAPSDMVTAMSYYWRQRPPLARGGTTTTAITIDDTIVVANAGRGLVRRSTDAGLTWAVIELGVPYPARDFAYSNGVLVAVGGDVAGPGFISYSEDAGLTWTLHPWSLNPKYARMLYGVAASGDRFVAVGDPPKTTTKQGGTIVRLDLVKRESGAMLAATAHFATLLASGSQPYFFDVAASGNLWVAVGFGVMITSSDGGLTWRSCRLSLDYFLTNVVIHDDVAVACGEDTYNAKAVFVGGPVASCVWDEARLSGSSWPFNVANVGSTWVAAGNTYDLYGPTGSSSYVAVSTDDARTWQPLSMSGWSGVKAIDNRFLLLGASGQISYSDDGKNWQPASAVSPSRANALVTTGGRWLALGQETRMSLDRGQTWTEATTTPNLNAAVAVAAAANSLVVVGDKGTILRSTDGGATWAYVNTDSTDDLLAVTASGTRVVAAGTSGTILVSQDAGATWTSAGNNAWGRLALAWSNDTTAVCAGAATIAVSANGGESFATTTYDTSGWDIQALWGSTTHLLAAGTLRSGFDVAIIKSVDGGTHWTQKYKVANTSVSIVNYLVGNSSAQMAMWDGGTRVRSTDGGESWIAGPSDATCNPQASQRSAAYATETVWLETGNGYHTYSTDLGACWHRSSGATTDGTRSVQGDGQNFIVAGNNLFLSGSVDDGATFTQVTHFVPMSPSPAPNLKQVLWLGNGQALAVGEKGTLLRLGPR